MNGQGKDMKGIDVNRVEVEGLIDTVAKLSGTKKEDLMQAAQREEFLANTEQPHMAAFGEVDDTLLRNYQQKEEKERIQVSREFQKYNYNQ